jgi:3-hydroxyacyl-CoA dehydrogenase
MHGFEGESDSMNGLVRLNHDDGIAVITIDNPPVNALSSGVPEGIAESIRAAAGDPAVRAAVVIGAGRTFIAGADIKNLAEGKEGPDLHELLRSIEDCPKPVVMALHGTALGGGLEVAMAGHYRLALASAQVGQPEVNLGIIPGAEGTQRLTRLAGPARAIEMCVSGKPLRAAEALEAGIIDQIVEGDLLTAAIAFARARAEQGGQPPRTRERSDRLGTAEANAPLFAAGREQARKTRKNQTAPLAAVEAIAAATTLSFDEGCRRERELFEQCYSSPQARAFIHAFLAERAAAKIPGISRNTTTYPIRTVGVVGAGTMGGGITMSCVNAGLEVTLREASQEALDRGLATIHKNYDVSVARGRFTPAEVEERMARIHPTLTWDGFERVDLIIEAVFENMAVKKQTFTEIDKVARPDCILASNTSTLDIDEIAGVTSRPTMVAGLHFFSPANVMRLLEIARGKATALEVLATALAFAKTLRKVGVVAGNCRGFIGNRMFFPYMSECQLMVEEGASPYHIDQALTEWGMAMGIFAVDDLAGIDIGWNARREAQHLVKPGSRQPLMTDKLYALGRYGQKTGKGWYLYDQNRKATPDPEVLELIAQTAREAGIPQRSFTDEEIIERALYAMINEGARILDEGIALRAGDIDTVYLNGYGFPGYRGGPMWYADTVGLQTIYRRVADFEREHGERWAPAPLLARLAERGDTFAELDRALDRAEQAV